MDDCVRIVDSADDNHCRGRPTATGLPGEALAQAAALDVFEDWSAALARSGVEVPGLPFLRLWLRRGTLEPLLRRELGLGSLSGDWDADGRSRLRAFPLGVVGHWPAANIEIQPVLSMTCALLGGNVCLVRVPRGLVDATRKQCAAFGKRMPPGLCLIA